MLRAATYKLTRSSGEMVTSRIDVRGGVFGDLAMSGVLLQGLAYATTSVQREKGTREDIGSQFQSAANEAASSTVSARGSSSAMIAASVGFSFQLGGRTPSRCVTKKS